MDQSFLKWFGHMEKMRERRLTKRLYRMKVYGDGRREKLNRR